MDTTTARTRRVEYQRRLFAMRQVRDCVAGSDTVKRSGELYVPIPSGFLANATPTAVTGTGASNPLRDSSLAISDAPWHHPNAAFSAYLHRAKFPDLTSNTLRGLVGVATKKQPVIEMPSGLEYLEELATLDGSSLEELYAQCISELFQVGRHALVLDIRADSTVYIAQYASEAYINWQMEVINGRRVQTLAEFETKELIEGQEAVKSLVYRLESLEPGADRICVVYKYTDGKLDEGGRVELLFQGKNIAFLPVVNLGAESNDPEPDAMPLLGVSDCALDIYRHSADLNQAQYMTCNPTLVFTGVDQEDAPRTIGSTVAICLSDPSARAQYVATDSSALTHVRDYISDTFTEAVLYGASLLGPTKRAAESAEALGLRQAASGATLVTITTLAAEGLEDILDMAAQVTGSTGEVAFTPNIEFAELSLSAPEIVAMMNLWMNGGISQATLLGNLATAGRLMDNTPEEEVGLMADEGITGEGPVVPDPGTGADQT